ncbi:MAG: phosphatase PAP2 family protein [Clostridia bacterium]|jgi:undecaprenyl-diphosphatase|nr:phosphatase PAP2 family protein [Clostridia bacterium]
MEMNAIAIWINNTFAGFDQWMAVWVHNLYNFAGGFFTPFFEGVSFIGHDGIPLIIIGVVLTFFKKTRKYGTAMLLGLGIGALITNLGLKIFVARPRPYSEETKNFFQTDLYQKLWMTVGQNMEKDKSFPSGHTTAAFASMVAIFLTGNKKVSWIVLLFAVLMAIARIYLVVHFASDVLAGMLVGILGGVLGAFLAKKIPAQYYAFEWPFFRKKASA